MARITFKGLTDYEIQLSKLEAGTREIAEKATYEGAKIVADEVKKNIESLQSIHHTESMAAFQQGKPALLTNRMKQGLLKSFGITPLREESGFYNVKLGFDGYNDVITKGYPKGQPNNMIARACESGSSSMIKQPFMRTAVTASKSQAEAKMAEILDAEIKKKMED